jgi:hypothetical protein
MEIFSTHISDGRALATTSRITWGILLDVLFS